MTQASTDSPFGADKAIFEIGGQDLLDPLRQEYPVVPLDELGQGQLEKAWIDFLKSARVRIGTLLKSENVTFLVGAGASRQAGGVLLRTIPLQVERDLLSQGISGSEVADWLLLFYQAAARLAPDPTSVPESPDAIVARFSAVDASSLEIEVNLERLLSLLWRWRAAIPSQSGEITLAGEPPLEISAAVLDNAIQRTTTTLGRNCRLPTAGNNLDPQRVFLRKILTRPLNLTRVTLVTTNYDTLLEQAADAEGIFVVDGFVGSLTPVFRPESFNRDLYYPAETTEGRVHRFDRVVQLYKIHGSVTWRSAERSIENPYGVRLDRDTGDLLEAPLIYPTPAKHAEALGLPYSELFRRFASAICRPQTTLFTVGYGFGDDHVNTIIWQAMAIPSFTLVVVDPFPPAADPQGGPVAVLRSQADSRLWMIGGSQLGTFDGFVQNVLPSLREQEIERRVMDTVRALVTTIPPPVEAADKADQLD